MSKGLREGLGFEEVRTGSEAGLGTQNIYFTGSLATAGAISTDGLVSAGTSVSAGTFVSGANVFSAGSVAGARVSAGTYSVLPYASASGLVSYINVEVIVTGGMWVTGSATSGTTPVVVGIAGPASAATSLGVCLTTTASGGSAPILVRGLYKGLIAETSLNAGVQFSPGAGAALNTIKAAVNSSERGYVVMGGGSEAATVVYLN